MQKLKWINWPNRHGGFLGKTDKQLAEEDRIFKEVLKEARAPENESITLGSQNEESRTIEK